MIVTLPSSYMVKKLQGRKWLNCESCRSWFLKCQKMCLQIGSVPAQSLQICPINQYTIKYKEESQKTTILSKANKTNLCEINDLKS